MRAKVWLVVKGFAVDASLIAADANKERSVPGEEWRADADAGRAVQEYLATLDDAAFGAASPVTPKLSRDPTPRRSGPERAKGHAFFAYATNYLIDTDNAVFLDVEASRAIRQAEVGASRTMLDRTAERFGLTPQSLVADSAYGSAENLTWLVKQRGIAPHIPVFDKSNRTDGTISRSDFAFDPEQERYTCRKASTWCSSTAPMPRRAPASPRTGRVSTAPASETAMAVLSSPDVALTPRHARSRATSTKMPATWPAPWQEHRPMNAQGTGARRSRCCSLTSSASSGSVGSDCADRVVPATSSCSPPPHRTSDSSPSSGQ